MSYTCKYNCIDSFVYRLSHDIVTLMWITTFRLLTAVLRQAMVSTGHVSLAPWLFVIGAFPSSLWLFYRAGV